VVRQSCVARELPSRVAWTSAVTFRGSISVVVSEELVECIKLFVPVALVEPQPRVRTRQRPRIKSADVPPTEDGWKNFARMIGDPALIEDTGLEKEAMRRERRDSEPAPRVPRRFRVMDVMTRAVLADDADLRTTLAVLAGIRHSVDVNVHVWEPKRERWRLLTLGEQSELWKRRDRARPAAEEPAPER